MAKELNELEQLPEEEVQDGDWLLIFDNSAPAGSRSKKVRLAQALAKYLKQGGDHLLNSLEVQELRAADAQIGFQDGATITKVLSNLVSVQTGPVSAGASSTVNAGLSGVLDTDQLVISPIQELANGLSCTGWVSAEGQVSLKFYNSTGTTIPDATYSVRLTAFRFA